MKFPDSNPQGPPPNSPKNHCFFHPVPPKIDFFQKILIFLITYPSPPKNAKYRCLTRENVEVMTDFLSQIQVQIPDSNPGWDVEIVENYRFPDRVPPKIENL